jgi:hypothetical protein
MTYKKRNSESDNIPQLVEYLQAGILVRFDITEETKEEQEETYTYYSYVEFWVPEGSSRDDISTIVESEGYSLSDEYSNNLEEL